MEENEKKRAINKANVATDEELMKRLNSKILEEEIDDLMKGEERIVLSSDEEYREVDGVKMVPFSLEKELGESKFKDGHLVREDDSEYEGSESDIGNGGSQGENLSKEEMVKLFRSLVDLIGDQTNVTDALIKYENDNDKLVKLTDCASQLLYSGFSTIYTMSKDEIIKQIQESEQEDKQKEQMKKEQKEKETKESESKKENQKPKS